jgi:hypothetical protein
MANVSKWSNVAVAVQSALSASQVVSGITKAATGVATYVGTDPVNGDYVALTANGMYQVDGRIFRVANVNGAGNTLELEGEATTSYDTFTSGSLGIVTFGTSLTTLVGLSATGGEPSFISTTTIHDNVSRQIPGIPSPVVFSFESLWDPADAGLVALKAASDASARRAVRFTFSGGQKLVFNGYISCTLLPVGNAQDKVTTNVTINLDGNPTVYAS